jgi:hypothetical protein
MTCWLAKYLFLELGRPRLLISANSTGLGPLTDDPSIDDIQTQKSSNDDPPRFSRGRRVLLRNVLLTIWTALGVLVNVSLAIRTWNCAFVVRVVYVILFAPIVTFIPVVWICHMTSHELSSGLLDRSARDRGR